MFTRYPALVEGARRFEGWARSRSDLARWGFVAGWYGLIFLLTQVPGTDKDATYALLELASIGDLNGLARIAAHLLVFGILGGALYIALGRGRLAAGWSVTATALALGALLAIGDELHQALVPGRHGRLVDVAVDAVGIGLALGMLAALGSALRSGRGGLAAGGDGVRSG